MLKNDIEDADLKEWQHKLRQYIPEEAQEYFIENNTETHINFPVHQYPEKPKSLNIVKEQSYTGKLVGIKGQYLIFEDQTVFNVRANEGLVVNINV
jgi:kynurenine formamidase